MLIGIDMIGAQSPEGGGRPAGRFARHLAAALVGRDAADRYVLYLHAGMPTDHVPSRKGVHRVVLSPVAGRGPARRRLATQRLLDRNPDGLDWLLLLDPFDPHYGGRPPEAPLDGVRIASVLVDSSAPCVDERDLATFARHDLVLAVTEAVASEGRRRLGAASGRVRKIEPAARPPGDARSGREPMTTAGASELARLGIAGPFLLADASSGAAREGLGRILDAYADLPVSIRARHQLAIAGRLDDPDAARSRLHARGCEGGLVLLGPTVGTTYETLLGRCAAFLSPTSGGGTSLAEVEAMGHGALVVGDSGGDLGDPGDVAGRLAALLSDPALAEGLREDSARLASEYSWEAAADSVLSALGEAPPAELGRCRADRGHLARPRIAFFPHIPADMARRVDLGDAVPAGLAEAYRVDLYFDNADLGRVAGLPPEFGGFDARLFDRNDILLDYHAVAYEVGDADSLSRLLPLIRRRPGLVSLVEGAWPGTPTDGDVEAVRTLIDAGSRVVVPSLWHASRFHAALPEHADRVVAIAAPERPRLVPDEAREVARERMALPADALAIGRFGGTPEAGTGFATLHAFKDLARTNPDAVLVLVGGDADNDEAAIRDMAARLNVGHRVIAIRPRDQDEAIGLAEGLDLAIHEGDEGPATLLDLLRAGVPTIAVGAGVPLPDDVVRTVVPGSPRGELARTLRELAPDPDARSALASSARAYVLGDREDGLSASLWVEEVERCASDQARAPGRRPRRSGASREVPGSPHFPRAASTRTTTTAPRSR